MDIKKELQELKKMLRAVINNQARDKQELKADIKEVRDIALDNSKIVL